MASTYVGDPTNAATPQAAPSLTGDVEVVQPDDGDALNASSVEQAPQGLADYAAYFQARFLDLYFGTGVDGDLSLSGASITQLSSQKFYDNVTVGSLHAIRTNGWPIICRTKFEITASNAGIFGDGSDASGAASGAYGAANGPHGSVAPSNGTSAAYAYTGIDVYGLGGDGGVGGGSAPTATRVFSPGSSYLVPPYRFHAGVDVGIRGATNSAYPGIRYDSIRGGGAGSCGGASTSAGGAGAGGALVVIMAPTIIIEGSFTSHGGDGGNGATNGNGGGGGGGGAFLFVCQTFVDNGAFFAANAGAGGLGVGGGSAGNAGTAGNTTPYVVLIS